MSERDFAIVDRDDWRVRAIAAAFSGGARTVVVGQKLRERRDRSRTVVVTWIERLERHDWDGDVVGQVWMAGVERNTSRRTQAISVERLVTAYEPVDGWQSRRVEERWDREVPGLLGMTAKAHEHGLPDDPRLDGALAPETKP